MTYSWHDLVGNLGVATIVGSYLLMQLDRLDARGLAFSVANGVGAALVLLSLTVQFNLSAFLMEAFWLLISLLGVARVLRGRTSPSGR